MHSSDSHTVLTLSPDTDLSLFSALLHQRGIAHRVSEQAGQLVLDVFDPTHVQPVRQLYEGLARGEYRIDRQQRAADDVARSPLQVDMQPLQQRMRQIPVTVALIVLSVIGFLLVEFDPAGALWHWFTFQDFQSQIHGGRIVGREFEPAAQAMARGELWRMVTPIFLHFGWMHIVFNGLWTWDLARRIELRMGGWHLFFVVNAVAVGSNLVQYAAMKDVTFGGMSGVIYGLLGYCWIWDKLLPSRAFMLPRGVAGFMVGWLIFCYIGLTEIIGIYVANEAHLGGLILGLIFGLASAGLTRLFARGRAT